MKSLTPQDLTVSAQILGCEPAVLEAVIRTQFPHPAFLPDGRAVVVFDREQFHRSTNHEYQRRPTLSLPKGKQSEFSADKDRKAYEAGKELNAPAAIWASAFGRFRLRGISYRMHGFKSAQTMADAMERSEGEQLKAFCAFMLAQGCAAQFEQKNWRALAFTLTGDSENAAATGERYALAYADIAGNSAPIVAPEVSQENSTSERQLSATVSFLAPPDQVSPNVEKTPSRPLYALNVTALVGVGLAGSVLVSVYGMMQNLTLIVMSGYVGFIVLIALVIWRDDRIDKWFR